jgi:hypothetical protein
MSHKGRAVKRCPEATMIRKMMLVAASMFLASLSVLIG